MLGPTSLWQTITSWTWTWTPGAALHSGTWAHSEISVARSAHPLLSGLSRRIPTWKMALSLFFQHGADSRSPSWEGQSCICGWFEEGQTLCLLCPLKPTWSLFPSLPAEDTNLTVLRRMMMLGPDNELRGRLQRMRQLEHWNSYLLPGEAHLGFPCMNFLGTQLRQRLKEDFLPFLISQTMKNRFSSYKTECKDEANKTHHSSST